MNDGNDPMTTDSEDRYDRATAGRLARLRTLPADVQRLDELVRAKLPVRPASAGRRPWFPRRLRAAAAVLVIVGVVAAVLLGSAGGPALASPALMAQFHDDMVTGKTPVMQVGSVAAANRMLAAQWPDAPGIPAVPADHVMACCM